jgi:SAM-dependent methyltransferase
MLVATRERRLACQTPARAGSAATGDNPDVSDALEFDPDLYRGAAGYYDRFRVPYPRVMLDELLGLVQPSGRGRLLDLACGTGQITFAIAEQFAEVWAVDQEPDMIRVVRDKARIAGASHVRPVVASAAGLDAPPGAFEPVAIGNAFHRLRRDAVAANAFRWCSRIGVSRCSGAPGPGQARRSGSEYWPTCFPAGRRSSAPKPEFQWAGRRRAGSSRMP